MLPSDIIRRARTAFDRGDRETAWSFAEHVLGAVRRHARARLLRALIAESEGRLDEALDDLSLVASAEPANPEARVAQGRIFQIRGDDARARAFARQAVELIPQTPGILESALNIVGVDADALASSSAVLGRVYLSSGWPALAERHARLGLEDGADRVDVRLTLAEALWRQGRLSECDEQCEVVFDQASDCVRAAVMRAHVLSEHGRTAQGQDLLELAGEIDPEYLEARELLATLEFHRLALPESPAIAAPAEIAATGDDAAPAPTLPPQPPAGRRGDVAGQSVSAAEGTPPEPVVPTAEPTHYADQSADSTTTQEPPALGESSTDPSVRMAPAVASGEQAPLPLKYERTEQSRDTPAGADAAATGDAPESVAGGEDGRDRAPETVDVVEEQPEPAQAATGSLSPTRAELTQVDWARELLDRASWAEAKHALHELVEEASLPIAEIDSVLEEATRLEPIADVAWKLLGDFRMRTSRPQAAAEAYLRAAEHVSAGE